MSKLKETSIFIFRRDFRIEDNTGLINCCKKVKNLSNFYIHPRANQKNEYKSSNAIQFMIESLKDLKESIEILNILYGDYKKVIEDIIKNKITSIYTNTDYTPYAKKRDEDIQKICDDHNINFKLSDDICLLKPGTILNGSGKPYQKFTPFYKQCIKKNPTSVDKYKIKINKLEKIESKYKIKWFKLHNYYTHNDELNINGGRTNALKVLKQIKNDDYDKYAKYRNMLLYQTTQLSGYLKFGCVSIREIYELLLKKYGINDPIIRIKG